MEHALVAKNRASSDPERENELFAIASSYGNSEDSFNQT
jgi:hypothetical protein